MLTNIAKEKIRSTVNELSFKDDAGVIGAFLKIIFQSIALMKKWPQC